MTVAGKEVREADTRVPKLTLLVLSAASLGWVLPLLLGFAAVCQAQESTAPLRPSAPGSLPQNDVLSSTTPGVQAFNGQKVAVVQFKGVSASMLAPLPSELELQPGDILDAEKVRLSLRRLYATGLYQNIQVDGLRTDGGLVVVFTGTPKLFLGTTRIFGVKNDQLDTQLLASTRLNPGTSYSSTKVDQSEGTLKDTLQSNGFYQGQVVRTEQLDAPNSQVNVFYKINPGKPALVGDVKVDGTPGISMEEFRKTGKLKRDSKVDRKTVSRALSLLRKRYDKKGHWAGKITLVDKQYQEEKNQLNYQFNAVQGPVVNVKVDGAKLSKGEIQRLVPIYEEGTVDLDLINEGAHNIRSYLQSKGYFDVTVTHQPVHNGPNEITALYTVNEGIEHRIDAVTVTGNKYFNTDTIREHISVIPANVVERHGVFSQEMVENDVGNITALYQGNGFSHVKVTPKLRDVDPAPGSKSKVAHISVDYVIDEGPQQKIGTYAINGAEKIPSATLRPMLNTQVGQPYSSINVTGDRDLALSYYFSQGYENAQVTIVQKTETKDPGLVDITMNITEGDQIFVNKVLVSGLNHTRHTVAEQRISIRPGQPLDQSALLDTQRKLYNLALFNEVNSAVQNPNGNELHKNVLVQITEAKRWDVTYGFGFQAQTGTPYRNTPSPAQLIQLGINPSSYSGSSNGHFGVSPDVLFDVSRINLRGTDQSLTLRTAYGTLEQQALVTYLDPGLFKNPKFDLALTGGYASSQNVTTYQASSLGANVRVTEHATKATTLIYSFAYREVKVNPNSIQVSLALIPLLSQPARIGGPGLTYIRDTRDNPLDAHRGSFNTGSLFFAYNKFGSQSNFGRLDATNSTYYTLGHRQWVIARQTRYGQERSFGTASQELIPLPERLYAGGATSHRGFAINAAGPRDPQTGYPLGGDAAFVNTVELRTPYPTLPFVGNNVGFVLFHDMGNVFNKSGDIWRSIGNFHQPDETGCRTVPTVNTLASGTFNIQTQPCGFNYFSHALGLGLRYKTPIGPIRVDTSYNLNPPYYPEVFNYQSSTAGVPVPQTTQAGHINFFFSIGQSF